MTSMASALPRPGDMSGAYVCQPHCVNRAALHDQANAIRGWEVPCWAASPSSPERAWAPSPGGPAHHCLCVPHPRGCTPRHSLRCQPGDLFGTPCSASLPQRHGSLCWAEMLEAWWLQALNHWRPSQLEHCHLGEKQGKPGQRHTGETKGCKRLRRVGATVHPLPCKQAAQLPPPIPDMLLQGVEQRLCCHLVES